jgi:GTP-binding protein HflX
LFDSKKKYYDSKDEKALLVYVKIFKNKQTNNNIEEFIQLTKLPNLIASKIIKINCNFINAKYLIGSGKVAELATIVQDLELDLVVFSTEISPSQERNLEAALNCKVIDRIGLILEIFSARARSFEGKLQVELAQLKHLSTRLIRGWTHLERQKGGIGLRGPGETQLETDKRLIGKRIKSITKRLEKVHKQRDLGRKSRVKNQLPMIALAGYTNSGKSTLFNTLTNAQVFADNRLFATLDSTIRRVILPASGKAVIADTVGFIKDLPPELIAAFKSTLEETSQASLLLHVVDAVDEYSREKIEQVEKIIIDINAFDVPSIIVMNKIDMLENFKPRIDRDKDGKINRVWISAYTGEGIDLLYQALSEKLSGIIKHARIKLDMKYSYIRNEIHSIGYIINEKVDNFGFWVLEIFVTKHYLYKILQNKGVALLWEQKPQ